MAVMFDPLSLAAAPLSFAARLLWPARCAGCDGFVPERCSFCEPCAAGLLPVAGACPGCAMPGRASGCAACQREPSPFDDAAAVLVYGGAVTPAVLRLKHAGRIDLARPLGRLLVPALLAGPAVEGIVPVPLHPRRLRTRGFNQVVELVRGARSATPERRAMAPLLLDVLRRKHDTPSLGHLSPAERHQVVKDAFVVPRPPRVQGRRFLLIDDVMTTGATLRACAATLREAGATYIRVLALARAV
jgi:ComF family protein